MITVNLNIRADGTTRMEYRKPYHIRKLANWLKHVLPSLVSLKILLHVPVAREAPYNPLWVYSFCSIMRKIKLKRDVKRLVLVCETRSFNKFEGIHYHQTQVVIITVNLQTGKND